MPLEVTLNSSNEKQESFNPQSKCARFAFVIGMIVGSIILGLSASQTFGPPGSIGFIASMTGGGLLIALCIIGVIRSAKANVQEKKADLKKQEVSQPKQQPKVRLNYLLCQQLYNTQKLAWVMVPSKSDAKAGKKPVLGIGSTSYAGAGHFKIHISIEPKDMEKAIPLVLKLLYQEDAPEVALKFQTKWMLSGDHQVGKEFALIFSEEVEKNERHSHAVRALLSKLHELFKTHGILPENGLVLTVETRDQIEKFPDDRQPLERKNLLNMKFDRKIPGSDYFFYRNEDYTGVADSEHWALKMTPHERMKLKMILFSEMDEILLKNPENIHNPLGLDDPYLDMSIT